VALAALELLVHAHDTGIFAGFSLCSIAFREDQVVDLDRSLLPDDWRSDPAPIALAEIGDEWLRSERSPVLRVPSAVIPMEYNYLINPRHSGFASLDIAAPEGFDFDPRLTASQ
jgi:RES domain-containing protein